MKVGAWGFLGLCCLIVFSANLALAEDSTKTERIVPEIKAMRINPHAPVIDGALDDAIWQSEKLTFAETFTQREPNEGETATEDTKIAVAYDDEAIYFGVWCYHEEPEKIQRQLVRRDRWSATDKIIVRIDPYHDHLTGNQFEVNVSGVQRDFRIYNDDWFDDSWNGVWSSGVKDQSWGWSAEMKIPYHCLRFTEKEEHTWGVDFVRVISHKNENVQWSFKPEKESGCISYLGHIAGITGVKPARHFEVLPYVVSNVETEPKTLGNPDGRDVFGNTGVDIKYGLSSNLTLDATINPDFGQVELDRPVLNLSVYETWFPERRPFFMEGLDLFETDFSLFYTRRIGRQPAWGVDDDQYDYELNRPRATTILGAAKLSGKLGSGTSVAFLNAVTEREKESYKTVNGETREQIIEPEAYYSIARVKQDVLGNSQVGAMMTLASQDTQHPEATGSVDWRLKTKGGGWQFSGQTVFTRTNYANTGYGQTVRFGKESGKHWRGAVGGTLKNRDFDIWRMGFTGRNDQQHAWSWVQYRMTDEWWIFRNMYNNFNLYFDWNFDGVNYNKGGNYNGWWEFKNNWALGWGTTMQGEQYDDLETRGNGIWQYPNNPTYSWWAELVSDDRKKVSFVLNPGSGGDRGGMWWANYIGMEYRPRPDIEFDIGTNYHRTFNATRWRDNPDAETFGFGEAVFADLDKDEVSLNFSASVMLSRNLSWQISAQGLISSLDYTDVKRYLGGKNYARDIADYAEILEETEPGVWEPKYEPYFTSNEAGTGDLRETQFDGTYSSLNSTMILRWEYRPGSTLFLVWTRSRPDWVDQQGQLNIGNEFDRFFSTGATNVVLIKASYWWNI